MKQQTVIGWTLCGVVAAGSIVLSWTSAANERSHPPYFWPAFALVGTAALILTAWALSLVLSKSETYYDDL